MLEGFKEYNMSVGTASVSISENGVGFSKTAVIKMEKPNYVRLLINDETKQIAIQKSKDNEGIKFYNESKRNIGVRWNNKELLKTISQMMDWDLAGKVFRVDGDYNKEDQALIFDLKNAEETESK